LVDRIHHHQYIPHHHQSINPRASFYSCHQVASLKRHGRQATGDLEAHSLQLTSAAKALQLAARSGTRALVAERRKATAACSLVS